MRSASRRSATSRRRRTTVCAKALGSFGVALARSRAARISARSSPIAKPSRTARRTPSSATSATRGALERADPRPRRGGRAPARGAIACAGAASPLKLKLARPLGGGALSAPHARAAAAAPTDDGAAIARAALRLLARVEPWEPIRLIGVAVTHLEPSDESQLALTLGGETEQRRSRLNAAVDAIHARFGDEKLRRGTADVRRGGALGRHQARRARLVHGGAGGSGASFCSWPRSASA